MGKKTLQLPLHSSRCYKEPTDCRRHGSPLPMSAQCRAQSVPSSTVSSRSLANRLWTSEFPLIVEMNTLWTRDWPVRYSETYSDRAFMMFSNREEGGGGFRPLLNFQNIQWNFEVIYNVQKSIYRYVWYAHGNHLGFQNFSIVRKPLQRHQPVLPVLVKPTKFGGVCLNKFKASAGTFSPTPLVWIGLTAPSHNFAKGLIWSDTQIKSKITPRCSKRHFHRNIWTKSIDNVEKTKKKVEKIMRYLLPNHFILFCIQHR